MVCSDDQPQPAPVRFFWDSDKFSSTPSRDGLNSNAQGGDVVRVEVMAEIAEDAPPATEIPEYMEKYRYDTARIGFDPDSFARATPRRSGRRPRRFLYPATSSSTFSP